MSSLEVPQMVICLIPKFSPQQILAFAMHITKPFRNFVKPTQMYLGLLHSSEVRG
jgi:hypothetical protein